MKVPVSWMQLLDLGVREDTGSGEVRRLRLTNAISFIVAANAVPFVFLFGAVSPTLGALTLVAWALMFAAPALNALGRTQASRYVLVALQPTALGVYAELVGPELGLENMLFGASILPLLVFSPRRRVPIVLGVGYAWTYRMALLLTDNDLFMMLPRLDIPQSFERPLAVTLMFVTLILLAAVVSIPVLLQDRSQSRLEAKNEELRAERIARTEADERSASKTRFLANMSHELRTPLHTIIGYTELIDEAFDEPTATLDVDEMREDLGRVRAAGSHMLGVISDILDLSRIESGRVEINTTALDLASFLDDLKSSGETLSWKRGNTFAVEFGELPAMIETDDVRLRQILLNLLSNAAKFTDRGDIVFRATYVQGGTLRFEVEDTGQGIATEHLTSIFDVFQRADAHQEGAGLGLAVSRELAHMLGGELEVRSEVGVGSTFSLTLRIEPRETDT